ARLTRRDGLGWHLLSTRARASDGRERCLKQARGAMPALILSIDCGRSFPICWAHVRPLYFVAATAWECAAAHSHAGQLAGLRSASLLAASNMACIHIIRGELRTALRIAHQGLALDHTTEAAVLVGSHQPNPATGPIFMALGVIYYIGADTEPARTRDL